MTHPVYSARLLSAKGIVRLRQIAKELGVNPKDGRTIQSHVDAITRHQASKIQPVKISKSAQIKYSDGFEDCEPESYAVIVDGNSVREFRTYPQAEGWISRNGYKLDCGISPFEQYLANLVAETEEVIDDYLFHDDIKMERGSGRDEARQLVAV